MNNRKYKILSALVLSLFAAMPVLSWMSSKDPVRQT